MGVVWCCFRQQARSSSAKLSTNDQPQSDASRTKKPCSILCFQDSNGFVLLCVRVRMFFQPAQPNFGKSEAISYVNPSKFRPGGQQQFSYSQTPRSRQDLRGVRGVCVRLPTTSSVARIRGCGRPARGWPAPGTPACLLMPPACFSILAPLFRRRELATVETAG